jgi:pimeloyl-ACP methyl ester carboxylesterase
LREAEGFRHQHATINGLRYHYVHEPARREGSGPPLFLIHGWPGFYYEWHLNIKPLAQRFDVVVPDMRGYGHSDKPDLPPEEGYTDEVMAEDLRALVRHLGFDKVSIVSHDFGSVWTQRLVRTHPELVDRLVFFQPVYPGIGARLFGPDRMGEIWYLMFHQLPWAEELVGSSRRATEIYLRHFLSHWSYDKSAWTDDEVEQFVKAFSQPGALRGGFNCYRAVFRAAGRGLGGSPVIAAPTLVLWAENDPIFPIAWTDKLSHFFSNLTLRRVPQCGHWVQREKPELVNQAIAEFINP